MKARIKWAGDVMFIGESGSGHTVVIDGPEELGGRGSAMRPMELLLLGLGSCSSIDVVTMLKKSRQDIHDCIVDIDSERSEEIPHVFTAIHIHYRVTGKGLKEAHVKRAVALSAEKYCSASIMLGKTAKITHDYQIIETDQ